MIDAVDLAPAADRHVGAYSLGMRQRLSLAAALLGNPPVLILDEPANGLDPQGVRTLRDLLRSRAASGGTVLVSSHLLAEVEHLADDIVILAGGRLISSGPLSELQHSTSLVRTPDPDRTHRRPRRRRRRCRTRRHRDAHRARSHHRRRSATSPSTPGSSCTNSPRTPARSKSCSCSPRRRSTSTNTRPKRWRPNTHDGHALRHRSERPDPPDLTSPDGHDSCAPSCASSPRTKMPWAFLAVLLVIAAINATAVVFGTDMDGSKTFVVHRRRPTVTDRVRRQFPDGRHPVRGDRRRTRVRLRHRRTDVPCQPPTTSSSPRPTHRSRHRRWDPRAHRGNPHHHRPSRCRCRRPSTDSWCRLGVVARLLAAAGVLRCRGRRRSAPGSAASCATPAARSPAPCSCLIIAPPLVVQLASSTASWMPSTLANVLSGVTSEVSIPAAVVRRSHSGPSSPPRSGSSSSNVATSCEPCTPLAPPWTSPTSRRLTRSSLDLYWIPLGAGNPNRAIQRPGL